MLMKTPAISRAAIEKQTVTSDIEGVQVGVGECHSLYYVTCVDCTWQFYLVDLQFALKEKCFFTWSVDGH